MILRVIRGRADLASVSRSVPPSRTLGPGPDRHDGPGPPPSRRPTDRGSADEVLVLACWRPRRLLRRATPQGEPASARARASRRVRRSSTSRSTERPSRPDVHPIAIRSRRAGSLAPGATSRCRTCFASACRQPRAGDDRGVRRAPARGRGVDVTFVSLGSPCPPTSRSRTRSGRTLPSDTTSSRSRSTLGRLGWSRAPGRVPSSEPPTSDRLAGGRRGRGPRLRRPGARAGRACRCTTASSSRSRTASCIPTGDQAGLADVVLRDDPTVAGGDVAAVRAATTESPPQAQLIALKGALPAGARRDRSCASRSRRSSRRPPPPAARSPATSTGSRVTDQAGTPLAIRTVRGLHLARAAGARRDRRGDPRAVRQTAPGRTSRRSTPGSSGCTRRTRPRSATSRSSPAVRRRPATAGDDPLARRAATAARRRGRACGRRLPRCIAAALPAGAGRAAARARATRAECHRSASGRRGRRSGRSRAMTTTPTLACATVAARCAGRSRRSASAAGGSPGGANVDPHRRRLPDLQQRGGARGPGARRASGSPRTS